MASSNGSANFVRSRKKKSIWTRILLCLAVLVAAGTVYALTTPAQTANKVLVCTRQEHTHTDACYAQTLICGQEESDAHTHTDACYASVLSCGLEEHTHTDACYILEYEPETEELTVTKVWDDADDQDGKRPDSVTFTVTGSDGNTYDVELTGEGDTWTGTVEVQKYWNQGEEVTFEVDEAEVAGYEKEIDNENLTITNSYEPETTERPR